ncbi:lysin A, N-acetylmuramoyl-L-alanine amidase domain [Gordonia phage ObLaDi]|uniref:Lysin A, N-acetylmuramoyl-L-alanine amidase domain n=3 Tax=Cafassovirus TaxID=3425056 RepID=A0A9E7TRR3_9CAUD|nr:lysin A, N-acetylmuramoyl-L-alanine amidase domain [Gordonia phage Cafasso]UVK59767.1 lysin A, N-acetylmuramoyl-L-alanine amidase domain [Gordonia phage Aleemily]UXE03751.1 lysin A, N-acetylmuramoyl-L-alanine amidase domain [Gordonia phage ObLaDi]
MSQIVDLTGTAIGRGGTQGMWNSASPTGQLIVIHDTESWTDSAALNWMRSQQNGSYHRLYGLDGKTTIMVPYHRQSWSAMTTGNRIGYHLCATGYASWRLALRRRLARVGSAPVLYDGICSAPATSRRRSGSTRWADYPQMLDAMARDIAELSVAKNIPLVWLTPAQIRAGHKGLCGHAEISKAFGETDHTDPGTGFPRADVIARARRRTNPNLLGMTDPELGEFTTLMRQLGES